MKLLVRRRALRQVDAFSRYIAERRPASAVSFENAFRELTIRLAEHPSSAPLIRAPDLRQITMTRFPYVIVFRATLSDVTILGVFHAARHPSVRTCP